MGLAKAGPPVKQATPVRFPLLKRILDSLPQFLSDTDSKLFKAAFSLAYFASLRVSEYAVVGSSNHTLKKCNLDWHEGEGGLGLVLSLGSYKASERPCRLLVPPDSCKEACPVKAMKEYLEVRPQGESKAADPLFLQSSGRPLTGFLVNKTLRNSLRILGLSEKEFSAHSFRAGRTTDLVEMDTQDSVIRQSGRWRSDAYLKYVRFDLFSLPRGVPSC